MRGVHAACPCGYRLAVLYWFAKKGLWLLISTFQKNKLLSYTASAGLIIGKNDAKGERGWKMKKRKENNVGPIDLSGVMWTEPRVRRLKTMLVFGRVGPRVAMGNTCGGVSRRPALRGKGGVLGGSWKAVREGRDGRREV